MTRPAARRVLELSLAAAGILFLSISLGSLGQGWLFQHFPRLFTTTSSLTDSPPNVESRKNSSTIAALRKPTRRKGATEILGRFEIPSLHVSTLVVEGDGEKSLRLGVGHVPGTALAGASGNTVLAAHRDTFFRCLRNVKVGDEVDFSVDGKPNRYKIVAKRVVQPDDLSVMTRTDAPRLTLITCYPFVFIGSAPQRMVIEAEPYAQSVGL